MDWVAPARERGLKWVGVIKEFPFKPVAPARERGLKFMQFIRPHLPTICRSREGAWIEICHARCSRYAEYVAPARERGLKSKPASVCLS